MKLLLKTIILLLPFTFSNCKKKKIDYVYLAKNQLLGIIYKGYQKDDKYYLSGCSNWFGGLEKEIKKDDKFRGLNGMHGEGTIFKVEELTKDSLSFSFEQHFNDRLQRPVKKGKFSIPCFKEKDIISDFEIQGIPINKEGAQQHISEGKFYRIITKDFSSRKNGLEKYSDACTKEAISEFGFQEYYFSDCIPIKKCYEKIEEYNDTIFNHLVKLKKYGFEDFESLNNAFAERIESCRNEKR